jgi:hypothetical protein
MELDVIAGISIPRTAQIRPFVELRNAGLAAAPAMAAVNHDTL